MGHQLWQIHWTSESAVEALPITLRRCSANEVAAVSPLHIRLGDHLAKLHGSASLSLELDAQITDGLVGLAAGAADFRSHCEFHIGDESKVSSSEPIGWTLRLNIDGAAKSDLSVDLRGELRQLTLLADVDVRHSRTVNTLGNLPAEPRSFDRHPDGHWVEAADASVLFDPAEITIGADPACQIELVHEDRVLYDGKLKTNSESLRMPKLAAGSHLVTVRARIGEALEEILVGVNAEEETFASLPISRRFVKGVDVGDGHLTHTFTDVKWKARGVPLELTRTYANLRAADGPMDPSAAGFGWTHNYSSWAEPKGAGHVVVVGGEGSGRVYRVTAPGTASPGQAGYNSTLTQVGTQYLLRTPAGILYTYARAHASHGERSFLKSVVDANGNRTRLEYRAADGLLDRVYHERVDAPGQRHLRFTYTALPVGGVPRALLTSVQAWLTDAQPLDPELTVTYHYDAQGNLTFAGRAAREQVYTYSREAGSLHRMESYTDPDKVTTTYQYLKAQPQRVESVVEPMGRVTKFTFGGGQTTVETVGAATPPTVYRVNQFGLVKGIDFAEGRKIVFDWSEDENDARLLLTETDAAGRRLVYHYTGPGNLKFESLSLKPPSGDFQPVYDVDRNPVNELQTVYTYHPVFNHVATATRTEFANPTGKIVYTSSYAYDAHGNLLNQQEPHGRNTTYTYNAAGDMLTKVCSQGESVRYSAFNELGQPQRIERTINGAKTLVTTQKFDDRGLVRVTEDSVDGIIVRRTDLSYDALDYPKFKTEVNGAGPSLMGELASPEKTTEYEYSPGGFLRMERVGASYKQSWQPDGLGRVKEHREWVSGEQGPSLVSTAVYDFGDRVTLATDRRGITRHNEYDALGRLKTVTLEWQDNAGPQKLLYSAYGYYGKTDLAHFVTDHQGNVTEFTYDTMFHLAKRILPGGDVEQFLRDTQGNPLVQTGTNGAVTRFTYDQLGQKLSESGPGGLHKKYDYFADGKLRREEDIVVGLTIDSTYDGLGRVSARVETLKRPAKTESTKYEYDDIGHRTRISSWTGATVDACVDEYHDDRGLMVKRVLDPDGRGIPYLFKYDAMGNLVEEYDPSGAVRRHTVDGLGRKLRVDYDLGYREIFDYDGEGNLLSHTHRAGNQSRRSYDVLGRILREDDRGPGQPQFATVRSFAYDNREKTIVETDASGAWLKTWIDGQGRETKAEHSVGPGRFRSKSYEGGNLAAETDWRGNEVTYTYDEQRRRKSVSDAIGLAQTGYDDAAGVQTEISRGGVMTSTEFDSKGRETRRVHAGVELWRKSYDSSGRMVSVIDSGGNETRNVFDAGGKLLRVALPGGRNIAWTYDIPGGKTFEFPSEGAQPFRVREYDKLGRLAAEVDEAGYKTSYEYDGEGRKLAQTDAEQLRIEYTYDNRGNLTSMIRDPHGVAARYVYKRDAAGRLQSVTDPTGNATEFGYDALGRVTSRSLVSTHKPSQRLITTYDLDADGRIEAAHPPDKSVQRWRYDPAGRLIWSGAEPGPEHIGPYAAESRYTHDFDDRLQTVECRVVDGGAESLRVYKLEYDALGRFTKETALEGPADWIAFAYDGDGRRTLIRDAFGEIQYQYDARGRLTTVTGPLGTATYDYYGDDRVRGISLPDGHRTEYDRYPNGWVREIRHLAPGAKPLLRLTYELDKVGDPRRVDTVQPEGSRTTVYTPDRLHRLQSEQEAGGETIGYAYDNANRRVSTLRNGIVEKKWERDEWGRLIAVHNAAGALVAKLEYCSAGLLKSRWIAGLQVRLGYNASQRLSSFEWGASPQPAGAVFHPEGGLIYEYDYQGRRRKTRGPGGDSTDSLYAGADVHAELTQGASALHYRLVRGMRLLGVTDGAGRRNLAFSDRLGSVLRLQALAAGPAARQEFDAFGHRRTAAGDFPAPLGFAGGLYEPVADVVHMGERIYDSALGQFWTADPLEPLDPEAVSEDPYTYARNRPTSLIDPSGLWPSFAAQESDDGSDQPFVTVGDGRTAREIEDDDRTYREAAAEVFGEASAGEERKNLAVHRPWDTGASLRPEIRSVASSSVSQDPDSPFGREATVVEGRSKDENRAEDGWTASSLVVGGTVSIALGFAVLAAPVVGVVAGLTGAALLASGIASVGMGFAYGAGEGRMKPQQRHTAEDAMHKTVLVTSSPVTILAGAGGAIVDGERGMTSASGKAAAAEALFYLGRGVNDLAQGTLKFEVSYATRQPDAAERLYNFQEREVKAALRESHELPHPEFAEVRPNSAGPRGVERKELSHWPVARRDIPLGQESTFNHYWNTKPLWGVTEHAYVDPQRWQFLPRSYKATQTPLTGLPRLRVIMPNWMQDTSFGMGLMPRSVLNRERDFDE